MESTINMLRGWTTTSGATFDCRIGQLLDEPLKGVLVTVHVQLLDDMRQLTGQPDRGSRCGRLDVPAACSACRSQSLGVGSELAEIWSPNRLRCLVLALALAFSQSNSEPMRMSAVAMLVARGTSCTLQIRNRV